MFVSLLSTYKYLDGSTGTDHYSISHSDVSRSATVWIGNGDDFPSVVFLKSVVEETSIRTELRREVRVKQLFGIPSVNTATCRDEVD